MSAYTPASMHRYDLLNCNECGCYYCLSIFSPKEITEWCDTNASGIGLTAICPRCGVDAVIGARASDHVDPNYLQELRREGFDTTR